MKEILFLTFSALLFAPGVLGVLSGSAVLAVAGILYLCLICAVLPRRFWRKFWRANIKLANLL